ncbi:TonB-dependent receptor plug domain-containing protein [Kaarinaea lacus]
MTGNARPAIIYGLITPVVIFLSLVASNIQAADTTQQAREPLTIVITGSNIPVSDDQSNTTTIISKQQIEQVNAHSVSQLLTVLPGLHVENAISRGSVNALYLRGAEPNYTAVLINGVKVNDPTNSRGGAYDFSLLDISTIERIEIVKGPVSSLYGSDAMAGVINIITRKAVDERVANVRVEAGSNELLNASVSAGHAFTRGSVALKASHADDGEQIEGSGYKANAASLGGEYQLRGDTLLSMSLSFQDAAAQSFPDNSGGPEYAVIRDVDKRDTQQQHHYLSLQRDINSDDRIKLQFNYFTSEEKLDAVGIVPVIPAYTTDSNYQRQNIVATYTSKPMPQLYISIGSEMEWEEGQSSGVIDPGGFDFPTSFNMERRVAALFGELQYELNTQWRAYLGLRVDSPENISDETSPRLGLSYQQQQTMVRFDWGEGFKLPSFYALGHPLVGNPGFKPETSESYQVMLRHNIAKATQLEVTGFWNRYFDLIDFDATSNVLVQRSEVEINGVEIAIKHEVTPSLRIQLQYTDMTLDIVNSDDELEKRPDKMGTLAINWNINSDMQLSASANYVGEVKDSAVPTGLRTLDSYTRIDASLGWRLSRHWSAQVALDNVLDEDYEEAIGFKAPGVGVRFSVAGNI